MIPETPYAHSIAVTPKLVHRGPGAFKKLRQCDLERVKSLCTAASVVDSTPRPVGVTNCSVMYTASIRVGDPSKPTFYTVQVDSGSSNLFVGVGKEYVKTKTGQSTGDAVSQSYGIGWFSGTEYTDEVALASDLVIKKQGIAVASESGGFSKLDGILGIGPVGLTKGTFTSPSLANELIPTVLDNLFTEGVIDTKTIGIFFRPSDSYGSGPGYLIFGGGGVVQSDSSIMGEVTGEINYVPITKQLPSSNYWGIDMQSITLGDDQQIMGQSSGVVDSGTTLLTLNPEAYQKYQKATGAKHDPVTNYLTLTKDQFENLESLWFNIGGVKYELTANAQIWPRGENVALGGKEDMIYLVVANGESYGEGQFDFVLGYLFLQRFYAELDATNNRVGLATTQYTYAKTN